MSISLKTAGALLATCAGCASSAFAMGPATNATPLLPAAVAATQTSPAIAMPVLFDFRAAARTSASTSDLNDAGVSTSAAPDGTDAVTAERESLSFAGGGAQPPTRRRYGRSRYQDHMHNSDGSSKIAFVGGFGGNFPVGNTGRYYTPSYNFEIGAGLNFSKYFGVLGEYHYDHLGVTDAVINAQYNIYAQEILAQNGDITQLDGLDANAHVHSLTIDPIINLPAGDRQGGSKLGAYVTGGVGYYWKRTNFTLPQTVTDGFYVFTQNQNAATYSASGFGVNGGAGLTYALSGFSSERLFVEARYNWIKIDSSNNADDFPYNRRNTEYIPVTVGLRF